MVLLNCINFPFQNALRNYISIVSIFLAHVLMAQSFNENASFGLMPGFLIAHRADLKNIETHMMGFEAQFDQLKENKEWSPYYNRPIWGLGLAYFHLGGPNTGGAFAVQTNLRFKVVNLGRSSFQFRMGTGLGYATKVFDVYANRRNQALGSHLNAFMQTAFLFSSPIAGHSIQYGFGISHFSNAAYKMPNLGYNLPSLFLRYSMVSNSSSGSRANNYHADFKKQGYFAFSALYAHKERNFARPVAFNHWGVQSRFNYQYHPIKAWRIGVDAMLDKTYMYSENTQVNLKSIPLKDQLELGLAGGHEWRAGDLRYLFELGAYVLKPAALKRPMYQRMGFIYNANNQLGIHGALKFHRGVADYFELGIVYSI